MRRTATAGVCVGCGHCPDTDRADVRDIVSDLETLGFDPTVEGGDAPACFFQEQLIRALQSGPGAEFSEAMGATLEDHHARSRATRAIDAGARCDRPSHAVATRDARLVEGVAAHGAATTSRPHLPSSPAVPLQPPTAQAATPTAQAATPTASSSSSATRVVDVNGATTVRNERVVDGSSVAAAWDAVEAAELAADELAVLHGVDVDAARSVMFESGGDYAVAADTLAARALSDAQAAETAMQMAVLELVRTYPITEDYARELLIATGGAIDAAAVILDEEYGRDSALEMAIEDLVERAGVTAGVAREALAASGEDTGAALAMLIAHTQGTTN